MQGIFGRRTSDRAETGPRSLRRRGRSDWRNRLAMACSGWMDSTKIRVSDAAGPLSAGSGRPEINA